MRVLVIPILIGVISPFLCLLLRTVLGEGSARLLANAGLALHAHDGDVSVS